MQLSVSAKWNVSEWATGGEVYRGYSISILDYKAEVFSPMEISNAPVIFKVKYKDRMIFEGTFHHLSGYMQTDVLQHVEELIVKHRAGYDN